MRRKLGTLRGPCCFRSEHRLPLLGGVNDTRIFIQKAVRSISIVGMLNGSLEVNRCFWYNKSSDAFANENP